MARYPSTTQAVASIRASVYSSLAHKLERHQGEVYPFHVGDTWLAPPAGCGMEDLPSDRHPGINRYTNPHGLPALLDAIVERTRARTGVPTERGDVLVTAGATGGLGAVLGALLDPGDEVLILAPHWPLIEGIVRSLHGEPVTVPFIGVAGSPEAAVEAVAAHLTPRTVALYLNTPNNPTGRIIPRAQVEALCAFAQRHGLWILADEVYEDSAYLGGHTYCRPLAPERTFSIHSFSKAYGMAGYRCGYIVGPAAAMAEVRKIGTHTFYSSPTPSQLAALHALGRSGDAFVERARAEYQRVGRHVAARLGVPEPEGSTFLFLDVAARLDDRGLLGFLEDCVSQGLLLAPGPSFGPYPTHVRLCYTAAPPAIIERGAEVLARLLGRS